MKTLLEFGKRNLHLLIVGVVALVGLILGTALDFKLSSSMYSPTDPGNAFTVIVAGFAEFPCYLFCTFGGVGLIVSMPKDKKWKKVLCWIFGVAAILISTGLGVKTVGEYLVQFEIVKDFEKILKICGIIFALLCSITVVLVVIWKRDLFNKQKLFKVAIYLITIAATYVVLSNVIKYFVCRPRPMLVFASSDPTEIFRNWFIVKPLDAFSHGDAKDLYLSFPSGHTGAAMTVAGSLPILFSLFEVTNKKKFEIIGIYTGLIFAVLCAFGRILCGAHFLSDVSMASLLVVIEIIVIKEVLPIIFRKVGVKNE